MIDEILEPYDLVENINWKGTFKDGQFFISQYMPNLQGYSVKGLNNDRKPRLISRFILEEDIKRCNKIENSRLLEPYMEGK